MGVDFDQSLLELVESKFEPGEEAEADAVGAGGQQNFTFQALKQGKTRVTLICKRPWEEHPVDEKAFTVSIK